MLRIADLQTIHLIYREPDGGKKVWSGGYFDTWSTVFVRVVADNGLTGLGEVYQGSCVSAAVDPFVSVFKDWLLGENALELHRLWNKLYDLSAYWNRQGFPMGVLGAIDIALHDLAGKSLGRPVHELLGGAVRARVPMYFSAGCTSSLDELATEIEVAQQSGFRGYKWRSVDPAAGADCMARLRGIVGNEFDIMVDAVQGGAPRPWPSSTVETFAEAIAPFRPAWLEEPYRAEALEDYARLRSRVEFPIAGAEVITSKAEAERFFAAGALDVFQPDVTVAGGLTQGVQLCQMAARAGVRTALHCWGGGVSLMANVHLGFCDPNCFYVEYCRYPNPLREELLVEPLRVEDGTVGLPRSPGLGVELTDETLRRYEAGGRMNAGLVFELT